MSNGCGTGAKPTPDRVAEEVAAMCYKIAAPEFMSRISRLSHIYPRLSLRSHLCYKISGPRNIPFL